MTTTTTISQDELDALTGEKVTVAVQDGTTYQGTLKAHTPGPADEPRVKVGRRVVAVADLTAVLADEEQAVEPDAGEGEAQADPVAPAVVKPTTTDLASALLVDLRGHVQDYVRENGSAETDAPQKGLPFVQSDRVYMQVEGRVTGGLLTYLAESCDVQTSKGVLRTAVADLGFTRKPFSYSLDGKQTSASYYSAPVAVLGDIAVEARSTGATGQRATAVDALRATVRFDTVPMRPTGTPEQVAQVERLWQSYRGLLAQVSAAIAKGESEARVALMEQARVAKEEWIAYRRSVANRADTPVPA